jgi:hypothetical protein
MTLGLGFRFLLLGSCLIAPGPLTLSSTFPTNGCLSLTSPRYAAACLLAGALGNLRLNASQSSQVANDGGNPDHCTNTCNTVHTPLVTNLL